MSVDPLAISQPTQEGVSFNGYEYGRNNPFLFIDPEGTQTEKTENTDKQEEIRYIDIGFSSNPVTKNKFYSAANQMVQKELGVRQLERMGRDFEKAYKRTVDRRIAALRKKGYTGEIQVRNIYLVGHGGPRGIEISRNRSLSSVISGKTVGEKYAPQRVIHVGCGMPDARYKELQQFFGNRAEIFGPKRVYQFYGAGREVTRLKSGVLKLNKTLTAPAMSGWRTGLFESLPFDTHLDPDIKADRQHLRRDRIYQQLHWKRTPIASKIHETVSEAIKAGQIVKMR